MNQGKLNAGEIEGRLIDLGAQIARIEAGQLQCAEWRGADVKITSDFQMEPDPERFDNDLILRTRHAVEVSWLFVELCGDFSGWLDYTNKYGFYESLGRAALSHLAAHQPEGSDPRPLLRAVLGEAFNWLVILKQDGRIPPNTGIVIHLTDSEGHQERISPEELF